MARFKQEGKKPSQPQTLTESILRSKWGSPGGWATAAGGGGQAESPPALLAGPSCPEALGTEEPSPAGAAAAEGSGRRSPTGASPAAPAPPAPPAPAPAPASRARWLASPRCTCGSPPQPLARTHARTPRRPRPAPPSAPVRNRAPGSVREREIAPFSTPLAGTRPAPAPPRPSGSSRRSAPAGPHFLHFEALLAGAAVGSAGGVHIHCGRHFGCVNRPVLLRARARQGGAGAPEERGWWEGPRHGHAPLQHRPSLRTGRCGGAGWGSGHVSAVTWARAWGRQPGRGCSVPSELRQPRSGSRGSASPQPLGICLPARFTSGASALSELPACVHPS